MSLLGKYELSLARVRESKECLYQATRSAQMAVDAERGASLRTRLDVVLESNPKSHPKRFRAAAVELAVISQLHGRRDLRDDLMSLACHLRREDDSCHCGCGGSCVEAKPKKLSLEKPVLGVPKPVSEVLRSPGEQLDHRARRMVEDFLVDDLGDVRIHSDARAIAALQSMNAFAFAAGNHVVMRPGSMAMAPGGLLVHELIHVLQQKRGGDRASSLNLQQEGPWEREAEEGVAEFYRASTTGVAGRFLAPLTPSERMLQCNGYPSQCIAIGCPATVPARIAFAPDCQITDCEELGFWPPVFARCWCTYQCYATWQNPEAAWVIITWFGMIGPNYTS